MSQINSNGIQVGSSATATNNFSLTPDGAGNVTLARGNYGVTSQNILTVNNVGDTVFAGNVDASAGFTLGQTWQDVSASRTTGTTYYNTTGKSIVLYVNPITSSVTITAATIFVDNVLNFKSPYAVASSYFQPVITVIPNGSAYYWTTDQPPTSVTVYELR